MRELGGWALALAVWSSPFAWLISVGVFFDGGPFGPAVLVSLSLLLLPALWLLCKRLREPSRDEVAEADGRRAVLVLHGHTHTRTGWWTRLWPWRFVQDFAEHRLETALDASLTELGPVLHLARPAPPPAHGPVALANARAEWEPELEDRLRAACLIAIVVDGTAENRHELERAAAILGTQRVIMIPPARRDRGFDERWATIRAELPALPELDPATAAVRFDDQVRPTAMAAASSGLGARRTLLASPTWMLRNHERAPLPKAPAVSWLLTGVPILFALLGAFMVPFAMRELGARVPSDAIGPFSTMLFLCAIAMAVLSRRAMRLVPSSELPMVLVASLPWLLSELVGYLRVALDGRAVNRWLEAGGVGAGYSIPLLIAASVVLAGASLIRRSPGRSLAYAVFGLAPLIPFVALYWSVLDADGVIASSLAIVPAGFALALTAIAASGHAGRRHAPLPVGAAVCVALALAATGVVSSHDGWVGVLNAVASDPIVLQSAADEIGHLRAVSLAWPWFALAVPAVVVLVAAQFEGRASRTAGANALTLFAMVLLVALATSAEANAAARASAFEDWLGTGLTRRAGGELVDPDFTLATVSGLGHSVGPADVVLDRGGALAGGRRVSNAVDLATTGGPSIPQLTSALGDRSHGTVRVAADPRSSVGALHGVMLGAFSSGASHVEVLADQNGVPSALSVYPPRREPEAPRLRIRETDVLLLVYGTTRQIPDVGGRLNASGLGEALRDMRAMEPNRRSLRLEPSTGLAVGRWLEVAGVAQQHYSELSLTPVIERAPESRY